MNNIYHVGNINLKKTNTVNDIMKHEPKFDITPNLYSYPTKEFLPLVNVILRGGNKSGATIVAKLICMWDRDATDSIIERKYTNPYKHIMNYDKIKYSTDYFTYCTTYMGITRSTLPWI